MAASRPVVLALAALPLAGCGATGLSWVGEAHVQTAQHTVASASSEQSPAHAIPAMAEKAPDEASRPRLSRTVTLGESELMGAQTGRSTSPSAQGSGVSVTVNNYNVSSGPAVGYGYYSRGYGSVGSYPGYYSAGMGGSSYSRPSSSVPTGGSPQAGQNWPAISDHGSSFPLRAGPAAPWSRTP